MYYTIVNTIMSIILSINYFNDPHLLIYRDVNEVGKVRVVAPSYPISLDKYSSRTRPHIRVGIHCVPHIHIFF